MENENKKFKLELENKNKENRKLKENNEKINKEKDGIIKKFENENKKLNEDLLKANNLILNINNNEIKKLIDENNSLKLQLNLKDNEIKELKNKKIDRPKYDIDDIIVITFQASDGSVNYGIKCLTKDIFAEVEEKLYKKFDNLRNTNNMFTANAKPILRFKTINENNIKDGDIIQLFKLE